MIRDLKQSELFADGKNPAIDQPRQKKELWAWSWKAAARTPSFVRISLALRKENAISWIE